MTNPKDEKKHVVRRLLRYVKPYKMDLVWGALCSMGCSIFTALTSAAVYVATNGLLNRGSVVINKIPHFHLDQQLTLPFVVIPIVVFVVIVCKGFFDFSSSYFIGLAGLKAAMKIRNDLQSHIVRLSMDFFSKKRTGELMSRVLQDAGNIQNAISSVIVDLIKEPFTLLATATAACFWGGKFTILVLIVFPVVIIPIRMLAVRMKRIARRINEGSADINSVLHEMFTGVRVVKSFNAEEKEDARFNAVNRALYNFYRKTILAAEVTRPVIEIFGAIGVVLAIYYGTSRMGPAQFAAFVSSLYFMYEPIKKLSRVYNTIQQAVASGERVFEILDTERTVKESEHPVALTRDIQKVSFDHVYFSYGEVPVLNNIDLSVRRGEMLAIVGSSGSGKTTLVNLIPRFYDATRGQVLINDQDVRQYSFKSLRDQIGIVWQETFLFNATIRENIAYGKPDATLDEIKRVAETAYADEFIQLLPQGYDTVVGERGATLSGGERQRLAIARALLKDPPILILDEATSQLDTESEREVQKALDRLMEGRTVFVIAHRLSTVKRADRIIVLEEGRVVQDGKHDILVSKSGRYKELYELQFAI